MGRKPKRIAEDHNFERRLGAWRLAHQPYLLFDIDQGKVVDGNCAAELCCGYSRCQFLNLDTRNLTDDASASRFEASAQSHSAHAFQLEAVTITQGSGASHLQTRTSRLAFPDSSRRNWSRTFADGAKPRASVETRRLDRALSAYACSLLALVAFDFNGAIDEVLAIASNPRRKSNIALEIHEDQTLPPVWGDRTQIEQVVFNLIQNAVQSREDDTGRPRKLRLATRCRDLGHALFEIEDSGPGFPDDRATRLFERFYTTEPVGTGLGLAVSRSIVEAGHGRIWASSAPGHGATFRFTLPFGPEG